MIWAIIILLSLSILWTILAGFLRFTWKPDSWGLSYDRVVLHVIIAQVLWGLTGAVICVYMAMHS